MKSAQFISEFEALLQNYIGHCGSNVSECNRRNAICVTVSVECDSLTNNAPNVEIVLNSIRQVCGPKTPVLPNHDSRTDADDQIRQILGQEFPVVVVDATRHWPDNVLGAAAGTVQTPGLLILLLPDGLRLTNNPSPYERHLKRRLTKHFTPHPTISLLWSLVTTHSADSPNHWQSEQQQVLDSILERCRQDIPTVDVLLARRGRGKSALVGRAIQALIQNNSDHPAPILSATHPSQVTIAQSHAKGTVVGFTALDKALQQRGSFLFVDEAGSVPVPVLIELTQRYTHTVLAGTVDGYEGAGRALAVRLEQSLDQLDSKHDANKADHRVQFHTLRFPIRWPLGDRLENMVTDVLRLEHTLLEQGKNPTERTSNEKIVHRQVTSDQLLNDESLLDSVFGLLMQAHYQTSSKDLQHLLNQNGLSLFLQTHNGILSGACLVAHEGGLDEHTIKGIKQGTRRPAHQKLPMLLHRQCANDDVLRTTHWRIVRIAIQPALQQQKLGTQLLTYVRDTAATVSHPYKPSYIGASFGGTAQGLRFWQNAGYRPFHWGYRLNPRSGQRAVSVALCVNENEASLQSLTKATDHFLDTINCVKQLNQMRVGWFTLLYGKPEKINELLNAMLSQESSRVNSFDDSQRLRLWQQDKLGLHDIWGTVVRSAGGVDVVSEWTFPNAKTAKQITQQIQANFFQ